MSILDPPLNEHEKKLIILLRTTEHPSGIRWSWQNIADELNARFSEYNGRTRHRDTIYKFMVRYRKEQRAKMIMELRLQGYPEAKIMEKVNERDAP